MKKILKPISLFAMIVFISGCSYAGLVMKSYIGKDINEVIYDYGYPTNIVNISENKRIYQWAISTTRSNPVTSNTTGTIRPSAVGGYANVNANTIYSGGGSYTTNCLYSIYAEYSGNDSWTITDYREPRLGC